MPKTIIDVISLTVFRGGDPKLVGAAEAKHREVSRQIGRIDADDNGKIDTVDVEHALEEYGSAVEDIAEKLEETAKAVDTLEDEGDQLLNGLHELLALVPLHIVLDAKSEMAAQAERWCSDNAHNDYDFISVCNAAILVFRDHADYLLFKIKFGV
ncbi:MAG: hypothetical protein DI537_49990 [Stutzerimonas stutzeri]|nr:MAG: hypothetical protein DI537_49990 [Stutzerimonas stutzeri]